MRILVLDDEQVRHDEFARRWATYERVHVKTVGEAIEALEGGKFDVATLDHDLEDFVCLPYPVELTGLDVARYIARMPPEKRPNQVVVHSWNPVGAANMVNALQDGGIHAVRVPFQKESGDGDA